MIHSPEGNMLKFAFKHRGIFTSNAAEYEAFLKGLEILADMRAQQVIITGDSQFIINQMTRLNKLKMSTLSQQLVIAQNFPRTLGDLTFTHIVQEGNVEANDMTQLASSFSKKKKYPDEGNRWEYFRIVNNFKGE